MPVYGLVLYGKLILAIGDGVSACLHSYSGTVNVQPVCGLVLYGKLMLHGHWGWCQCMPSVV